MSFLAFNRGGERCEDDFGLLEECEELVKGFRGLHNDN